MFLDWRQKLERANARQRQVNRENQQRERRWRDFLKTAETIEQEEERLRNEKKHAQFLKEQERKTQNIEAETNESVYSVRWRSKRLLAMEAIKELASPATYHFSEQSRRDLLDLHVSKNNWIHRSKAQSCEVKHEPVVLQTKITYDQELSNKFSVTSSTSIYLFDSLGKFVKALSTNDGSDAEFQDAVYYAHKSHALFPTDHTYSMMGVFTDVVEALVIHPASLPSWVHSLALVSHISADQKMTVEWSLRAGKEKLDTSIKSAAPKSSTEISCLAGSFYESDAGQRRCTVISSVLHRSGQPESATWAHTAISRGYLNDASPQPELLQRLGIFPRSNLPQDSRIRTLPASLIGKQFHFFVKQASVCVFHLDKAGNVLEVQHTPKDTLDSVEISESTASLAFAYLTESDKPFPELHVSLDVPERYLELLGQIGACDPSSAESEDLHQYFRVISVRPDTYVNVERPPNCLFPLAVAHRSSDGWTFNAMPKDILAIDVGQNFELKNANTQQLEALLKICMGELADVSNPDLNIVDLRFDGQRHVRDISFPETVQLTKGHVQIEARFPGSTVSVIAHNMLGKAVSNEMVQAIVTEWATSKNTGTTMTLSLNDKVAIDRQVMEIFQGKLPANADTVECLPTTLKIFAETPEQLSKIQSFRWTAGTVDLAAMGPTKCIVRQRERNLALLNVDLVSRDDPIVRVNDYPNQDACLTVGSVSIEMAAQNLKALDVGGSSDPFVSGSISVARQNQSDQSTPFKTKVIKKNLNPQWGSVVAVGLDRPGRVTLTCTVFDKDLVGEEEIGRVSMDITHVLDPSSLSEVEGVARKFVEIPLTSPKSKDPPGKRGILLLRAHRN